MKINAIGKKGNKFSFEIEGIMPSFANALRRCIVDEVPTMAISTVEFRKNNSTLYDEILAHRLGLVVLKTDLKSYNLSENCTCNNEGCAKCRLKLILNVKNPGVVTAKELESQDPKVTPAYPDTLLLTLLKGQEVQLEATAQLGIGKNHAKWSPGLCFYTYKAKITVNNSSKKFDEFKDKFPPQVFEKGQISKEKILAGYVDACEGICEDIVKIEYDEKTFQFLYEPWGQLDGKKTLQTACEILANKCEEFIEKVKAL